MATHATIKSAVNSVLSGITEISFRYDHHRADLEGYPAVTFDIIEERSEYLENRTVLRTAVVEILVYQETKIKGLDAAASILDNVANEIIQTFTQDPNNDLSGVVDYCLPVSGGRNQWQSPQGLVLYQRLTLRCIFRESL